MLGQALFSGRWVIDDVGADAFEPGDVVVAQRPVPRRLAHAGAPARDAVLPRRRAARLRRHCRSRRRDRRHGARLVLRRTRPRSTRKACACRRSSSMRGGEPVAGVVADHAREPPHARTHLGRLQRDDRLALDRAARGSRRSTRSTARTQIARRRPGPLRLRRGLDAARHRRARRTAPTPARTARRTTASRDRPYFIRCDLTIARRPRSIVDYSRSDEQARGRDQRRRTSSPRRRPTTASSR